VGVVPRSVAWLILAMQWCLPLRRQQAGRAVSPEAKRGAAMGKPITIVNKMAESVLTQEPQNASSLTQAPYPSLLQDKFATSCKSKVRAGFSKT